MSSEERNLYRKFLAESNKAIKTTEFHPKGKDFPEPTQEMRIAPCFSKAEANQKYVDNLAKAEKMANEILLPKLKEFAKQYAQENKGLYGPDFSNAKVEMIDSMIQVVDFDLTGVSSGEMINASKAKTLDKMERFIKHKIMRILSEFCNVLMEEFNLNAMTMDDYGIGENELFIIMGGKGLYEEISEDRKDFSFNVSAHMPIEGSFTLYAKENGKYELNGSVSNIVYAKDGLFDSPDAAYREVMEQLKVAGCRNINITEDKNESVEGDFAAEVATRQFGEICTSLSAILKHFGENNLIGEDTRNFDAMIECMQFLKEAMVAKAEGNQQGIKDAVEQAKIALDKDRN